MIRIQFTNRLTRFFAILSLLVSYLTWQSQLQEKYAAALDAESKDASKAADTQHIVAQLQHKVCLCVGEFVLYD